MDNNYVTPTQIAKAKQVDLLDYLKQTEPNNLQPSGSGEYRLKDHDSLLISNGKFNWFSRGLGGANAIDYLIKVRGLNFTNAVRELAGDNFNIAFNANGRAPPKKQKQTFQLPPKHSNNNDVIAYLKKRGIAENVINNCIHNGLLYQGKHQSCVFVGYDKETPKFACERGIHTDYKKDATGSNKAYNFCIPPSSTTSSSILYTLESPIDAMSHATIANTAVDGYRLSLGGVSSIALHTLLENNPQITHVYLCLDNDKAGKDATERIISELRAINNYSQLSISITPPAVGKDYNEMLQITQTKPLASKKRSDHTL